MINLNEIKITPRDQQVLRLLVQGCSNKEIASQLKHQPAHGEAAPAHAVSARGNQGRPQASEAGHSHVY